MNIGRFLGAAVGVWVVRVALNYTFYEIVKGDYYEGLQNAHPGVFREVIPAYVATDLLFALLFVFLLSRVTGAFGGVAGGAKLGVLVALLGATVAALYHHYSFTFPTVPETATEIVFQWVAHAIQGAVAGAIYKASPTVAAS